VLEDLLHCICKKKLRGGEARADFLEQVFWEEEQGASRAEARVGAHAEHEQQGVDLR